MKCLWWAPIVDAFYYIIKKTNYMLMKLNWGLLLVSCLIILQLKGQNVNPNQLSDEQLQKYMLQGKAMGLTEEQMIQSATAKGVTVSDIEKLKSRISTSKPKNASSQSHNFKTVRQLDRKVNYNYPDTFIIDAEEEESPLQSRMFGSDLFKGKFKSFEPNLRMATPKNYQIGPDDELIIDVYGYSEVTHELKVSPEGAINIPYVGLVYVNGLTMTQAIERITKKLSQVYTGIRTGNTHVQISLGNIRSIKVTLIGEVIKPGSYTLPSLATVFNALYASGGPNDKGSLRSIELIRNNKIIAVLDIYEFLLKGNQKNNLGLEDQDVIRIPPYRTRVEFMGKIKRPGLYEILPKETLLEAITFAGGFADEAYTAKVKVIQNTAKEHKIIDVFADAFVNYQPKSGDKYIVDSILNRYLNRVMIQGAVFRSGEYELTDGMKLSQLIQKSDGVTPDAFLNRGHIKRLRDDMVKEMIDFDLSSILKGETDFLLKREDVVTILSLSQIRNQPKVSINGEIKNPGLYDFSTQMTVEDLLLLAGGFKVGGSSKRVEIARRISGSDWNTLGAKTAEIFQIDVPDNFKLSTEKFLLQPFDVVTVRSEVGYERQRLVRVDGEVYYPGVYRLQRKNERISDLIKRVGGVTALGFVEGASLRRVFFNTKSSNILEQKNLFDHKVLEGLDTTLNLSDSKLKTSSSTISFYPKDYASDYVYVDIKKAITNPGSKFDLILEEGDLLSIPRLLQTVKISGEVYSPANTSFIQGLRLRGYVSQAGGITDEAHLGRSYVIYPNGRIKSTKKIFFAKFYPKIVPGAEIVVPKKNLARRFTTQDFIALTTGFSSLTAILITVVAFLKK